MSKHKASSPSKVSTPLEQIAHHGDLLDAIDTRDRRGYPHIALWLASVSAQATTAAAELCFYNSQATPLKSVGAVAAFAVVYGYTVTSTAIADAKVKRAVSNQTETRASDPAARNCDFIRRSDGTIAVRAFDLDGKKPDNSTPTSLLSLHRFSKEHGIHQAIIGYDGLGELLDSTKLPHLGKTIRREAMHKVVKGDVDYTLDDSNADSTLLVTNTENLPAYALAVCEALGIGPVNTLLAKVSNPRLRDAVAAYQTDHDARALREAIRLEIQTTLSANSDYDQQRVNTSGHRYDRILHTEETLQGNTIVTCSRPSQRVVERGFDHGISAHMSTHTQEHMPAPTAQSLAEYLGFEDNEQLVVSALLETMPADAEKNELKDFTLLAALYVYLDNAQAAMQALVPPVEGNKTSVTTTFQRMVNFTDKTVKRRDSKRAGRLFKSIAAGLAAVVTPGLIVYGANHYVMDEFTNYKAATTQEWEASHPGQNVPQAIKNMRLSRLGNSRDPLDLGRTTAYADFLDSRHENAALAVSAAVNDTAERLFKVGDKHANDLLSFLRQNKIQLAFPEQYNDSLGNITTTGDVSNPNRQVMFRYEMRNGEASPLYWMSRWYDTAKLQDGMVAYDTSNDYVKRVIRYETIEAIELTNPDAVVETVVALDGVADLNLPVPEGYSINAAFFINAANGAQTPIEMYKSRYSQAAYIPTNEVPESDLATTTLRYYLSKTGKPLVKESVGTKWLDGYAGSRTASAQLTAGHMKDIEEALYDYYDLPPDATVDQIGARIREKPYSFTPFRDSQLQKFDSSNSQEPLDRQRSALENASNLLTHNCNTANTTVGILTNFDDNRQAIFSGYLETNNDGLLETPGHMASVINGKIVDFTPSGGDNDAQAGIGSSGTVATAPSFTVSGTNLMLAGGATTVAAAGLIARKNRRKIGQFYDEKVTQLRENNILYQTTQATIDAVLWGPEGMTIPDYSKSAPQGYHPHNPYDPISPRQLQQLARSKGMPTHAIKPSTFATMAALFITDGSKRRTMRGRK